MDKYPVITKDCHAFLEGTLAAQPCSRSLTFFSAREAMPKKIQRHLSRANNLPSLEGLSISEGAWA